MGLSCSDGRVSVYRACVLQVHLNRTQLLAEVKRLLMPGEHLPSDAYYCAFALGQTMLSWSIRTRAMDPCVTLHLSAWTTP